MSFPSEREGGDRLWVWQERTASGWGQIVAWVPRFGMNGPLTARTEAIAREVFGPVAEEHQARHGNPVRLARFERAEVVAEIEPGS